MAPTQPSQFNKALRKALIDSELENTKTINHADNIEQTTFALPAYDKKKTIRRECFLAEMEAVVPRTALRAGDRGALPVAFKD